MNAFDTGHRAVIQGIPVVFVAYHDDPENLASCHIKNARGVSPCPLDPDNVGHNNYCSGGAGHCMGGYLLSPIDFIAWRLTK